MSQYSPMHRQSAIVVLCAAQQQNKLRRRPSVVCLFIALCLVARNAAIANDTLCSSSASKHCAFVTANKFINWPACTFTPNQYESVINHMVLLCLLKLDVAKFYTCISIFGKAIAYRIVVHVKRTYFTARCNVRWLSC